MSVVKPEGDGLLGFFVLYFDAGGGPEFKVVPEAFADEATDKGVTFFLGDIPGVTGDEAVGRCCAELPCDRAVAEHFPGNPELCVSIVYGLPSGIVRITCDWVVAGSEGFPPFPVFGQDLLNVCCHF